MDVCPDCKTPLEQLYCNTCAHQYADVDGIPILLSNDERFQTGRKIGKVYDDIYAKHTNVWDDQGRTPQFIQYFADLLTQLSTGRILELGCGEGYLLAAVRAEEKVAIDLSAQALQHARARASARYSVALAERLPLPTAYFDLVTCVGVMEHFLDDREATREVWRVLKPGGYYATLIHVDLNFRERVVQKMSEYIFPQFRPVSLLKWISGKVFRPIRQPIQHRYSVESGRACLEGCGFTMARVISKKTDPSISVIGPQVIIYVAKKGQHRRG